MKRLYLLISFFFFCGIIHANAKMYRLNNLFSISVNDNLELRQDDDAYTKFLHDTLCYVANSEIVFQQKNLSSKQQDAMAHYCRIMILTDSDESNEYPCSNDKSFSSGDIEELKSTAEQELGPGQRFIHEPTSSIEETNSGAVYVKIHYSRTGLEGAVDVTICYFFNYKNAVKAIFSYRESESNLWKDALSKSLNSFSWDNPYTFSEFSAEDNNAGNEQYNAESTRQTGNNGFLWGLLLGILFMLLCFLIYHLSKTNKRKKTRQLIASKINDASIALNNNRVVSATKIITEVNALVTNKYPEFQLQTNELERQLSSVEKSIDNKIDTVIDDIRKDFVDNSSNSYDLTESEKLLKNEEITSRQKQKIREEIASLEEEYKKGIIPNQEVISVKYNLPQIEEKDFYSFYTAPKKDTVVYPYRRRKIELRGYTESNFEQKLRASLLSNTNYKVLGDVSIQTSEGAHPYEPDIAIIEDNNKYGIRIDIEIDEPYSGYDKTQIHYIGCGDEFRDKNLANLGWIVIRFSEKQIYKEPNNCIFYIQQLISLIDTQFQVTIEGSEPSPDKRWSEVEGKLMAARKYRETLLHHTFGLRQKEEVKISTQLTDLEKKASQNVQPLNIPTRAQSNIDNSSTSFVQDSKLSFEPFEHIYLYDGKIELTAVSDVINDFFTPFDSIGLSKHVAIRDGISQCEVLEDWDSKGLESREVGTFLHKQIESYLSNQPVSLSTKFNYNGEFVNINKNVSISQEFNYFKTFLDDNPITPFRTEWHIFDLNLRIAGTIDLLCRNGTSFDMYDWKRSRKASPDERVWRYGINGLGHIPDISFYHYALQQNLYKYILETNYNISISKMFIVILHPDFDSYLKYEIPKMEREINIIIQHLMSN